MKAPTSSSAGRDGSTVVFEVQSTCCVKDRVHKNVCLTLLQHVQDFLHRQATDTGGKMNYELESVQFVQSGFGDFFFINHTNFYLAKMRRRKNVRGIKPREAVGTIISVLGLYSLWSPGRLCSVFLF